MASSLRNVREYELARTLKAWEASLAGRPPSGSDGHCRLRRGLLAVGSVEAAASDSELQAEPLELRIASAR
eukprot:618581-Hanusia_phi.AAC.1